MVTITEFKHSLAEAGIRFNSAPKAPLNTSNSSFNGLARAISYLPTAPSVTYNNYEFLTSKTTHIHENKSQKKEEDKNSSRSILLGVASLALAVGSTFITGKAYKSYFLISTSSNLIKELKSIQPALVLNPSFRIIDQSVQAVHSNRLWSLTNRTILATGLVFLGLGLIAPNLPLLIIGSGLSLGSMLSEALRLGINDAGSKHFKKIADHFESFSRQFPDEILSIDASAPLASLPSNINSDQSLSASNDIYPPHPATNPHLNTNGCVEDRQEEGISSIEGQPNPDYLSEIEPGSKQPSNV
jgi:hypothetical protein